MPSPNSQESINNVRQMPSAEVGEFIKKVVKRVHFVPDRYDIELELAAHIEDSTLLLQDQDELSQEDAEKAALDRMGDAKEIGTALNRQHNPFIGYMWYFSRILVVLLCILLVLQSIPILLLSGWTILFDHPIGDIPKESYVRHVKPNELIKLDTRRIRITDVIQTEDGSLHVLYSSYNLSFSSLHGWSFSGLGNFEDEDGEGYFGGSGRGTAGLYNRSRRSLENFPFDKDMLIVKYDYGGRNVRLEIPLGEVTNND
ncbi:MAG: permease prefix domain 1-containing protein [Anaerovoracaceae bacterium]